VPFWQPDADVVAIIDAPPTPLASPSPAEQFVVLMHYEAHPPIGMLARPRSNLAGLRLDPQLGGRQRTMRFTGLSVLRAGDGSQRRLALPDGAQVSVPVWAPGGQRFAFTVDEPDGVGVWTCEAGAGDPVQVPGLVVRDVLGAEPPGLGGTLRWSRDGRSLLALAAPPGSDGQAAGAVRQADGRSGGRTPSGPRTEEVAGKRSQMATFQDLLTSQADEDMFEELATTVPVRVDPRTGSAVALGPAGLHQQVSESPDQRYLLVHRLQRPFSYRVPYGYFARLAEVRTAAGEPVTVIADLPVSDEVPRMGVPAGPRQVSWAERDGATLIWVEALDGGDPMAQVPHRDAVMRATAPFAGPPELAFKLAHRCIGWNSLEQAGTLLLTERDRDRRWLTTWLADLAEPGRNKVVFDLSEDDAYGDPGTPMLRLHPDGTRTIRQDGDAIFLRGPGATPDGERPFLDRLDLVSGEVTRLFRSPVDAHESVLCLTGAAGEEAVIWHQSPAEPPNLRLVPLRAAAGGYRPLTAFPDPHPQFTGMSRRLFRTDRGDGVPLSGMLHTPPGYDPAAHGPLPVVIWAYPYDFGDATTAGQVRGSTSRFTRLAASDPVWFAQRGYAVLADATMPVIGDPETKNDSYIEQICAAAAAHVKALAGAGIADPARAAVAGHSYGAFMTANLLAHTDLFAAGIARSGAYNRTLTPFGFQTERRSFWEVPAIYDRVSPFRYADRITAPILLVHGADDSNSGTFPVQSERLFQAIQGNGGTARLVILPLESHGYVARESVLHVLAEQFAWLDRWLGPGWQP
jgi:dipeptidyl aminopeptidase/acylaminoacyl peptidase